jgi:hypothetical protein
MSQATFAKNYLVIVTSNIVSRRVCYHVILRILNNVTLW